LHPDKMVMIKEVTKWLSLLRTMVFMFLKHFS
jgi:hypothetical protein